MTQKHGYVVGSPISHSLSPKVHLSAYRALGLDWSYQAVEVSQGNLKSFLSNLDPNATSLVSVTMPLKVEAAEVATSRSQLVAELGIANTLVPRAAGWFADNTDVAGLSRTITSTEVSFAPGDVATVLGTGATAISAVRALSDLGFTHAYLCGRNVLALESLAALGSSLNIEIKSFDVSELAKLLDSKLVISTWPSEVAGQLVAPVLGSRAGGLGLLVDVTYHPWPTSLASAWFGAGGNVIGGLDLLVNQAIGQVELATAGSAPESVMREAVGLTRSP